MQKINIFILRQLGYYVRAVIFLAVLLAACATVPPSSEQVVSSVPYTVIFVAWNESGPGHCANNIAENSSHSYAIRFETDYGYPNNIFVAETDGFYFEIPGSTHYVAYPQELDCYIDAEIKPVVYTSYSWGAQTEEIIVPVQENHTTVVSIERKKICDDLSRIPQSSEERLLVSRFSTYYGVPEHAFTTNCNYFGQGPFNLLFDGSLTWNNTTVPVVMGEGTHYSGQGRYLVSYSRQCLVSSDKTFVQAMAMQFNRTNTFVLEEEKDGLAVLSTTPRMAYLTDLAAYPNYNDCYEAYQLWENATHKKR